MVGLIEKVAFDLRLEGGKRVSFSDVWGEILSCSGAASAASDMGTLLDGCILVRRPVLLEQ